jgi:hypothetical protein
LAVKVNTPRNAHELERLAMILDGLDRDHFSLDARGSPTYVFELISRMMIGLEAADVSYDYDILDGLIGQQRAALPIDIITRINKGRLQARKLATKSAYIDDDSQKRSRRSNSEFQYSTDSRQSSRGGSFRGRGGARGGGGSFRGDRRGGRGGAGVGTGGTTSSGGATQSP